MNTLRLQEIITRKQELMKELQMLDAEMAEIVNGQQQPEPEPADINGKEIFDKIIEESTNDLKTNAIVTGAYHKEAYEFVYNIHSGFLLSSLFEKSEELKKGDITIYNGSVVKIKKITTSYIYYKEIEYITTNLKMPLTKGRFNLNKTIGETIKILKNKFNADCVLKYKLKVLYN